MTPGLAEVMRGGIILIVHDAQFRLKGGAGKRLRRRLISDHTGNPRLGQHVLEQSYFRAIRRGEYLFHKMDIPRLVNENNPDSAG